MSRILAGTFFTVIFLFCAWRGMGIPFSDQAPLYEGLRNTAGIIFGVMGAWLAILYPAAFQKFSKPGERGLTTDEEKQVKRLFHPLVCSTVVLALTVLVLFLGPLFRTYRFAIDHADVLRGVSFGVIGVMTVMQIWTVILTLVPTDMLKRQLDGGLRKAKRVESMAKDTQVATRPKDE